MVALLGTEPPDRLALIASAVMDIRAYGPVKEAAVPKVKAEVEKMLAQSALRSAA